MLQLFRALFRSKKQSQPSIVLRDAENLSVGVTDAGVTRFERNGETKVVRWSEITSVFIVAIDGLPVGKMSWMIHASDSVLEIPTNSAGNKELLHALQERLSNFDNHALIEAMGMVHGFKKIWQKAK